MARLGLFKAKFFKTSEADDNNVISEPLGERIAYVSLVIQDRSVIPRWTKNECK